MANVNAVQSVSTSLVRVLNARYQQSPLAATFPMDFVLLSGGELADEDLSLDSVVSLYLYRMEVSAHVRNATVLHGVQRRQPLPLELLYMLTVWSTSAETEQAVMSWAVRHLHENPVLDRSSLSPDGGWAPDEQVHVIPADMSNEDLLRLWDTLRPNYRLSFTYLARVVLLESDVTVGAPVVATRFDMTEAGA